MVSSTSRLSVSIAGLLIVVAAGCSDSPTPVPSTPTGPGSTLGPAICTGSQDTANTVSGVVYERMGDTRRPLGEAIAELFLGNLQETPNLFERTPVTQTVTRSDGRYYLCLPSSATGSSGATEGAQPFEVRVRKDGYRTAFYSFRYAYSIWDYGYVAFDPELIRE
jgi:hypothetical protein